MMHPTSTTRLKAVLCTIFILYFALVLRLFFLQIHHHLFYQDTADNQHRVTLTTRPERACIYDRNGTCIAFNKNYPSAFIIPAKVTDLSGVKRLLENHFPSAAQRFHKNPQASFLFIKRHLTPQEEDLIIQAQCPDIRLVNEPGRFYPVPSLSSLLGSTDSDNHGIAGLEYSYDAHLAGLPSLHVLERDARSGRYYFTKSTKVEGAEGIPLTITIDSTLQFLVHEELNQWAKSLQAQEGAVLIMEPYTGEILALTQYTNPENNLTNHPISHTYELGSVMKTFLALAALEEQVVSPEEFIDCEGQKSSVINGMKINTTHPHGLLTFSQVIEKSNNIGTSKIALRLGKSLYTHYQRCGFGSKTGIIFPGEQAGYITPPARWSKRSALSLSFGYEIQATLLQLARAFALIANGGYLPTPKLVASRDNHQNTTQNNTSNNHEPQYSQESLTTLRAILQKTVTSGTAHKAAIKGYTVLGKTGSAYLAVNGAYQKDRCLFTFAGIIEKGAYKRVIVTFIKDIPDTKQLASTAVVPLFERIAQRMLIHDKIL